MSLAGIIALGFALGCSDEPPPVLYTSPVHPRASLVLEPATLAIGDVATLEVVVVTPPNHQVRPFAMPTDVPGFWILETRMLPVETDRNRWRHRTAIRLRPRETGRWRWPAASVEVEVPDGELLTLNLEALDLDVVSVLPQYDGRLAPFGLQPLEGSGPRANRWLWAGGGAGLALACVGLVWLARHRTGTEPEAASGNAGVPPWDLALRALESARTDLEREPAAACQRAGFALRLYMSQRFGAQAVARTTEEIERAQPPFAATSRWPTFTSLLRRLDNLRFPAPPEEEGTLAERALPIVDEARDFVRSSIPLPDRRASHDSTDASAERLDS